MVEKKQKQKRKGKKKKEFEFNPGEFVKDMTAILQQFQAKNREEFVSFKKEIYGIIEKTAKKGPPRKKATLEDIKKVAEKHKRIKGRNYYGNIRHIGNIPQKDLDEFMDILKEMMEVYGVEVVEAVLVASKTPPKPHLRLVWE